MTDQTSIDAALGVVEARAGGVDILINNAALFDLQPITEISRESYDRLRDMKTVRRDKRKNWWAKPCPLAAWAQRKI